jgi:tRNA nucleotidyltransferase (CCA-adding enzyme)
MNDVNEKNKEKAIREICKEILKKATPSEKEKEDVLQSSKDLVEKLTEKLQGSGIKAKANVQGSVAKDTWLAGEKDVDIFILLPKTYTQEIFPKVLDVIKALVGEKWAEAYAEHPYIEAEVEDYKIDFVPCFKIERAEEAMSSVDRTPLHTSYIKRHLDQQAKNEVRLLKRFMRGTETYGAEIKVGGFSGYLCELLALHYKSFLEVLKSFADWKENKLIDYEGYYTGREQEVEKIFEEPLIVVDPVDKRRNVASALRRRSLDTFIAASRMFLQKPSDKYFYPPEIRAFKPTRLADILKIHGSTLIFVKFGTVNAVPDVLWGQLYKSQKKLRKKLQKHDFNVVRDLAWSNEQDLNVFLFEVEHRFLPPFRKHLGPPIEKRADCEKFLQKHVKSTNTISGPRVERGRWIVETRRKYTDVIALLADTLKNGGRQAGVADLISQTIAENLQILTNTEILDSYKNDRELAIFLTEYLVGKPRWL